MMSLFLGNIFTLLTAPPGNFVYHFVLVFSIAGALLGAVQSLHSSNYPQERRTVAGLGILLGLQGALFIVSWLAARNLLNAQWVFPPLDRAVTLLSLVWIAWLWAFPEPVRMADAATLLLSLLGLVALGLTLALWVQNYGSSFNLSSSEKGWQIFSLAVILLGILGLVLRKSNGWGYGLAMLLLGLLGHLASLFFPKDGNFPGMVRLAQLAMFPILLTLSQRFPFPRLQGASVVNAGKLGEVVQARGRYATDPKTFHALMSLAAETDSGKVVQTLTRGIAQAMLADLCFLVTTGENKSLAITSGYDLVHDQNLGGAIVEQSGLPLLATAVQHGRPLHLPASNTSSDLKNLGQALGLDNTGNVLSVPVPSPKRGSPGSILLLSPYSNRMWNVEDELYLSNVSSLFIPILERNQRSSALDMERDRSLKEAHNAMERASEAKKKYEQLASELESQRGKMTQSQLQTIMQEEAQNIIEQLKADNYRLRNAGSTPGGNDEQVQRELDQALEEMMHMQNALAEADAKIMELEKRAASPAPTGQARDLGGNIPKENDKERTIPQPFDLNLIVDNALASTSTQIREKNITLRLDLTSMSPRIQADREALQQIMIHLLQNATAATKAEGNITLRVQLQNGEDKRLLFIQVTDNGGGIAPEDLARVFTRDNQAVPIAIKGLGDSGEGLLITKQMVEAQNGRLWLESQEGVGSTFSILIPVLVEQPVGNAQ